MSATNSHRTLVERLEELERIALIDKPLIREAIDALKRQSGPSERDEALEAAAKEVEKGGYLLHVVHAQNIRALKRQSATERSEP